MLQSYRACYAHKEFIISIYKEDKHKRNNYWLVLMEAEY